MSIGKEVISGMTYAGDYLNLNLGITDTPGGDFMAQKMVYTTDYSKPGNDILLHPGSEFAVAVILKDTGVVADSNGDKWVLAGTPIGGADIRLDKPNAELIVTNDVTNGANTQGLLRNDVNLRNGEVAGVSMIVSGTIDYSQCPTLEATAKAALTRITFVNGGSK
ncbi:MAG: hypothetical protein R3Y05_01275 [bacterium]